MKILHTSDLHIGKRMNDINLLDDQRRILLSIAGIAEETLCDAVIIAGDVYDKPNPSADAMALFDEFLHELSDRNIKVFVISGNHDSLQRVSYLSDFIRDKGIYVCGSFSGTTEKIILKDEYGNIAFHLLPFIKPQNVKAFYPDEKIETYDDAVRVTISHSGIDTSIRNIIVAHQFVTGAEICDSEVFAVGGLDNISAECFSLFDYAAMGHIHGPQHILRPEIRYSGSPMKYSFSEANHRKSVAIVEIREKGSMTIDTVPLSSPHDVREVNGSMEELMNLPYSEDFVRVTVTDESVPPDARISLKTVFPNMMKFVIENSKTKREYTSDDNDDIERKTPCELFCDFYSLMNNDVPPSEEHIALIRNIIERLGESEA